MIISLMTNKSIRAFDVARASHIDLIKDCNYYATFTDVVTKIEYTNCRIVIDGGDIIIPPDHIDVINKYVKKKQAEGEDIFQTLDFIGALMSKINQNVFDSLLNAKDNKDEEGWVINYGFRIEMNIENLAKKILKEYYGEVVE